VAIPLAAGTFAVNKQHILKMIFRNNLIKFSSAMCIGLASINMMACSESCDNEDPRARIINNGTAKASVQIWTTGGNTENINNIEPGYSSGTWRSFAPGLTNFTVAIQGENDTVITVDMLKCYEYSIDINGQNQVVSTAVERD
jgi:hypothetical protein